MMAGFHTEVLLASGYAVFLAGVALGLELLARHVHGRSERFEVTGFQYLSDRDAWECPTGAHLQRAETDHGHRRVLYRAPAHVCNACHIKRDCTDSDQGRAIERRLDSWLESELQRFHRGISLALLSLAAMILVIEIVEFQDPRDRALLLSLLVASVFFGARVLASLFANGNQASRNT